MPFIGGRASASRGFFGGGSRPIAPTGLSAIESDSQLTISFTPPSFNGGLTIENYEYALSTNSGESFTGWVPLSPPDTVSPITIGGLTNGQAYHVKLRAINALGGGLESGVLSTNTTPFTVAGAPTITGVTPQNGAVLVTYSAPSSNGGRPIQGYKIQHSSNGGTSWSSPVDSGNDLSHVVTGLTNGTGYIFRAYAYTVAGDGLISGNSSSSTPRTVPNQVSTPTPSSSDRRFGISWTALSGSATGGSSITGYRVQYSTNGGVSWVGTDTTTATSYTWEVSNGSTFIGRVQAYNIAGDGSYSTSSDSRVPTFAAPTFSAWGNWADVNQPGVFTRRVSWSVDPTDTIGTNKSTEIILQWMYADNAWSTANSSQEVVKTYSNELYATDSGTSFSLSGSVMRNEQYRVKARQTTDGHSVETGWINISIVGNVTHYYDGWSYTSGVSIYTTGNFPVNGGSYLNWSSKTKGGVTTPTAYGQSQFQVTVLKVTATSRNALDGSTTSSSTPTRYFNIIYSQNNESDTEAQRSSNSSGWPGASNRTNTYDFNVNNSAYEFPAAGRCGIDGAGASSWSPIIDVTIEARGNKRTWAVLSYEY